jgi:SsrA-binding protein
MADKINKTVLIKNKRAEFDYFFLTRYTAGIVLTGTEIKSIRQSKVSLVDTFCFINKMEIWVKNMYIAPYFYGSYNNPASRRDRKLLLNRKEIRKLQSDLKNPGFTIVPVKLFINDNGIAKLEIALAEGKKQYDKRQSIKEHTDKQEMARRFKNFSY